MYTILFSYTHIIFNQKNFLLRRLKRSLFEGNSNSLAGIINFGYVSMRERDYWASLSPEKWEIQKVYRKKKKLNLAEVMGVLYSFPCIGEKSLAAS